MGRITPLKIRRASLRRWTAKQQIALSEKIIREADADLIKYLTNQDDEHRTFSDGVARTTLVAASMESFIDPALLESIVGTELFKSLFTTVTRTEEVFDEDKLKAAITSGAITQNDVNLAVIERQKRAAFIRQTKINDNEG